MITKATNLVRILLKESVNAGDCVVDATCGNGLDTAILRSLVGETGRVISVDIQATALERARKRLPASVRNVHFVHACHSTLNQIVEGHPTPTVVVFNLGYLPGGDKTLITKPETTTEALSHALQIIALGGGRIMKEKRGHAGGEAEAFSVEQMISALDPKQFVVMKHQSLNVVGVPPYVLVIERRV